MSNELLGTECLRTRYSVPVAMNDSLMAMPVRMRHLRELFGSVVVLVMLIMGVLVRVILSLMLVHMFVPIRRQQERPHRHRYERKQAPGRDGLVQEGP